MSGHSVPYHLRTNKFIERQLFLDILDYVRIWNGPAKYLYASMGGRYLEDFKLINDRFSIEQMISIEMNENTCKRQVFNRLGFIDCRNQTSQEFLEDFDAIVAPHKDRRLIVWLDFAEANARGEQLSQFRQLVSKLGSGDVAKITLNANFQSFRRRGTALTSKDFNKYLRSDASPIYKDFETYVRSFFAEDADDGRQVQLSDDEYDTVCLGNLRDQLGDYCPSERMPPSILQNAEFTSFLSESIRIATLKGLVSTSLHAIPLGVFRYQDADHQMMTSTVLIADKALSASVQGDPHFAAWPFRSTSWGDAKEVNVPDLSLKERALIDGLLANQSDINKVHAQIPFLLGDNQIKSTTLLDNYIRHYRRYPGFARVR